MDKPEIKLAKKFFDRHFLNKFKLVENWEDLPRIFKLQSFSHSTGRESFEKFLKKGQFLHIKTDKGEYLVHVSSRGIFIVDEMDRPYSRTELEGQLNLPVLGLTFQSIIDHLKKQKENKMKKIVKVTESELIRLVKKIIKEQEIDRELGGRIPATPFDARAEREKQKKRLKDDFAQGLVLVQNESAEKVQEVLNNLPENLRILTITNCDGADFTDIDICSFPQIVLVNLTGTPNNFKENVDCEYDMLAKSLYSFS